MSLQTTCRELRMGSALISLSDIPPMNAVLGTNIVSGSLLFVIIFDRLHTYCKSKVIEKKIARRPNLEIMLPNRLVGREFWADMVPGNFSYRKIIFRSRAICSA